MIDQLYAYYTCQCEQQFQILVVVGVDAEGGELVDTDQVATASLLEDHLANDHR